MKLSGLSLDFAWDGSRDGELAEPKPGVSIRLLGRNLSEAENPSMPQFSPLQPAHSSPGLKAWGFLRRRINTKKPLKEKKLARIIAVGKRKRKIKNGL